MIFCSCGAQFAPPIGFELHRWHLPLRLGVTTVAWRAQGHRFLTCVGVIFSVKRCVQNLKKNIFFCSCGAQFAPPIGFELHRWHLPLRLGVTTGKTTTSDPKAFPKRLPPEQGNSMAWRAQGHRFLTCVGVIFSVKRCVQNL